MQEALDRAREAKIPGTPTFLVNGVEANRLNLSQVIDNELAKVSSNYLSFAQISGVEVPPS